MPFFDVQKKLGVDLDHWMTIQSAEQPHRIPARCHAFEKEWIECAHGIGSIRAEKECKIEFEDFRECLLRQKTVRKWWRWEWNYFLVSLELLLNTSNWSLGIGLPHVNWQNFCVKYLLYLGTMSRKLTVLTCSVFFLIFSHIGLAKKFMRVFPSNFLANPIFSLALCPAAAIRLEIACADFHFCVGWKVKSISQSWVFVLENVWANIFQIHWTLTGEEIKIL